MSRAASDLFQFFQVVCVIHSKLLTVYDDVIEYHGDSLALTAGFL